MDHSQSVSSSSSQILLDILKRDILSGKYPNNVSFPKLDTYVERHRVTKKTVVKVFEWLQREKLIHKKGKQFYAGPPPRRQAATARSVVLVLMRKQSDWQDLCSFTAGSRCGERMLFEALHYGVRLVVKVMPEGNKTTKIHQFLESLDLRSSLRGVLLLGDWIEPENGLPGLKALVTGPDLRNHPVVWLDNLDRYGEFNDEEKPAVDKIFSRFNQFNRCYFDEGKACRLVLDTLMEAGHRKAAYVYHPYPLTGWIGKRYQRLLTEAALLADKKIEILPAPTGAPVRLEDQTRIFSGSEPESFEKNILQKAFPKNPVPMNCTALIVFSDNLARLVYRHLTDKAVKFPNLLSMVSFDADPLHTFPYPISSVDFGGAYLGYTALHLMLGIHGKPFAKRRHISADCNWSHLDTIAAPP